MIHLYDDPEDLPRFAPFTQSRPIGELVYGAYTLRERVAQALGPVAGHLSQPHLARYTESGAPPVVAGPGAHPRRLLLRSSFVPGRLPDLAGIGADGPTRFTDEHGTTVGAALSSASSWHGPASIAADWPAVELPGRRLAGAWDIVADLVTALQADLAARRSARPGTMVPAGCTVLGDVDALLIDDGARIEPLAVFDTRQGPVWVRTGAEVRTFSRLAGPLVVGENTRIVGGQLRESSIGPRCVVHGEVSNSVFLGFANKAHDGFLGHSVVGRWANLGAGSITSNLKNTYGTVRLDLGTERVETGMVFLGSLIGDHVKTAIGTMLSTGSVLGTGANVFGTRRPGVSVAPFAWGTDEPGRIMACRMFLQTAARVLPRREVACDDATRAWLTAVWEHATGQACG